MYHTLLLDVDGTLLDFQKSQEMALKKAFQMHGYALTPKIKARYEALNHVLWKRYEKGEIDRDTVIYTRFGQLFTEVGIDGDGIAFENEYQELLGGEAHLLPGAGELVEYLSRKYHLYVVTNGVSDTQWRRLNATGLSAYMEDVFISGELGFQKPQKEFFTACFSRMEKKSGKKPDKSKMLIIGDTLSSDILGGNNAGIDTCWYNPGQEPKDPACSVTLEIHALDELYEIL